MLSLLLLDFVVKRRRFLQAHSANTWRRFNARVRLPLLFPSLANVVVQPVPHRNLWLVLEHYGQLLRVLPCWPIRKRKYGRETDLLVFFCLRWRGELRFWLVGVVVVQLLSSTRCQ